MKIQRSIICVLLKRSARGWRYSLLYLTEFSRSRLSFNITFFYWMLPGFPCFFSYSIKKRPFANEQQQYNNTFQLFGVIMLCFMCCCCLFSCILHKSCSTLLCCFVCLYNIFFLFIWTIFRLLYVIFFMLFGVVGTVVRKV